jgi:hypothetical protein
VPVTSRRRADENGACGIGIGAVPAAMVATLMAGDAPAFVKDLDMLSLCVMMIIGR